MEYPNIIVLFVPANLTELCQPLDQYFNALLKMILARLRNARVVEEANKFFDIEDAKVDEAKSRGESYQLMVFKAKTKLSELKEPFFEDLAIIALSELQTEDYKQKFRDNAWAGMFEKCFEPEFQCEAVKLVGADQDNYYFTDKAQLVDPVFAPSASQDLQIQVADAHDEAVVSTPERDAMLPPHRLVGRQVKPFNDSLPGRVEKYLARRKLFVVKYWKDPHAKRASKIVNDISREDLMAMLLYNDTDNSDVDDEEVELTIPSRVEPQTTMANEETTPEDDNSEDDDDSDDDNDDDSDDDSEAD
jgi:hypothetical protein